MTLLEVFHRALDAGYALRVISQEDVRVAKQWLKDLLGTLDEEEKDNVGNVEK